MPRAYRYTPYSVVHIPHSSAIDDVKRSCFSNLKTCASSCRQDVAVRSSWTQDRSTADLAIASPSTLLSL